MTRSKPSDQDIIRAARGVFIERGLGATTEEIAARAGVAKGTLHRRFGSKAALVRAALTAEPPPWTRQLDAAVGVGDPRDSLFGLFEEMIRWSAKVAPLAILAWSVPSTADAIDVSRMRGERELALHLHDETMAGRLFCIDPEQCAAMMVALAWDRALVGAVGSPVEWLAPLWYGLAPRMVDELDPFSSEGPRPSWPPRPTAPPTAVQPASPPMVVQPEAPPSSVRPTTPDPPAPEPAAARIELERTQRSARPVRADRRTMLRMLSRAARWFRRRGGRRHPRRVRRRCG